MIRQILLLFSLWLVTNSAICQAQHFEWTGTDVPVSAVINDLETKYGWLFSYEPALIEGLRVTGGVSSTSKQRFLNLLFQGTGIQAEVVEGAYILLRKRSGTQMGRMICGQVVAEETGEVLPGATVAIQERNIGTYTDENGDFRFFLPESVEEEEIVNIQYLGFQDQERTVGELLTRPCRVITLEDAGVIICCPIIIEEYITDGIIYQNQSEQLRLQPSAIPALPGQPEPDVMRTLQFLPGISSPTGELSKLYVRGGTPDQNLILWEGIPIYHSAHYFGMVSGFNPFAIQSMEVYRGGFGANYGGRISGLVDMTAPEIYNDNSFGGGVNMLLAHTQGNVGLAKDEYGNHKASVSWSLRRSLADLWPSPTYQNITRRVQQGILFEGLDPYDLPPSFETTNDLTFWDGQVKAAVKVAKDITVKAAGFRSANRFQDDIRDTRVNNLQQDSLRIVNQGGSLSAEMFRNDLYLELIGSLSRFDLGYDYQFLWPGGDRGDRLASRSNSLQEGQLALNGIWTVPFGQFLFGYAFNDYQLAFDISQNNNNTPVAAQSSDRRAGLHGQYLSYQTSQNNAYGLEAGLRVSVFGPNHTIYPEPRLHLWTDAIPLTTISLHAGRYRQFLSHLLEFRSEEAGIETPIWVLSGTPEIPVVQSDQVQLAILYKPRSWVVDVQGYWRNLSNLSSLSTGFDPGPGGQFHLGSGTARGVDLLVRKRWPGFRTWVSYSLSEVVYRFPTFIDPEFHASHDQRHQLSIVNQATVGDFQLSLGWTWNSGTPYTTIQALQPVTNPMGQPDVRAIFGPINEYRLPANHQLNASVLYTLRPSDTWTGEFGISVINLYNQENLYYKGSYIDRPRNSLPRIAPVEKVDLRFTPNVVVRVGF